MALPDQLDILGYISPKAASMHWVVSGDASDVGEIERRVLELDGTRLLAKAEDNGFTFARFEFPPDMPYRSIASLIFEAQRRRLATAVPQALIGFLPTGNEEDLGDTHARQPIVGIIGSASAIAAVKGAVPWASFTKVFLTDGREGEAFRPTLENAEVYHTFVQSAVTGSFADVDVVLLVEPLW